MNKSKDIVIEQIEEIFIDSNLSLYEVIGVLEIIKQRLFKTVEIEAKKQIEKEINGGWDLE